MRYKWRHLIKFIILFPTIHGFLSLNQASPPSPQQQQPDAVAPTVNINNALTATNNIKPLIQAALAETPNVAPIINDSPIISQKTQKVAPKEVVVAENPTNYGSEDPIIYLDYSTINDQLLRKRTANFVYFNANFSHCRHCYRFFNIWKELAVDIRWWKPVIKLFTINCSDEDNIEMCRRAGVTQFPQVMFYWTMSNSLDRDGQRLRILGKSVHAMRHLIMDRVLDSYVEHNKFLANRAKEQLRSPHNGLIASNTMPSSSHQNPLASLMMSPIFVQLLSGSDAGGGGTGGMSLIKNLLPGKGGLSLSGLMSNLGRMEGIGQFVSALMNTDSMRRKLSAQPLPSNWPELESIEVTNTQQLLDMLPLDTTKSVGALLIMESQEFLYTGLEVMLDLSPYSNQTYVARVKDERSQLSKNLTKRDDIQVPALIYVTASREPRLIMTAPKYTNDEDLRRAFVRTFERRKVKYPVKRVWPSNTNGQLGKTSSDSQEDEDMLNKINQVSMNDLINALRTSLMEQVFRHLELSDDQYNALVKYVYTLIDYFPFNNNESLKFCKRLHTWLQNQVSPIDINEYKKQFHDIEEVFQPREWVTCKSLSNGKSIPIDRKKSGLLFDNPAQLGKVVSNITRLFRGQQQQLNKLKNLFGVLTSNRVPVHLNKNQKSQQQQQPPRGNSSTFASGVSSSSVAVKSNEQRKRGDDSHMEGIFKSLTNGSLGSDSSILKLISTTLTGGSAGKSGKSKFSREYPCGAWKLAHVLVVNEYIKDSPRKDVKHIVLHSLYHYMLQFYSCPTCGNRVSDVSGEFRLNLDEHLQDQGDSVMLLWKMHNRVNKRLEDESRPGSPPKSQFPNESLCPKCRLPRTENDLVSTPIWREKQVLNFLVHHYRQQSIITNTNLTDSSSATTAYSHLYSHQLIIIHICLLTISSWLISFANTID